MPIHQLHHVSTSPCSYLIWYIDESEDLLYHMASLTPAENGIYKTFSNPKRRIEWLASRIAYQALCHGTNLPYAPLYKDDKGRPYLPNHLQVSLSHCFPFTVAAIHNHSPMGVDIQIPHPKLQVVKARYLTPTEAQYNNQNLTKLCIYWCTKEAIYKAHGQSSLSSQDIHLLPFEVKEQGVLHAQVLAMHTYVVHYQVTPDYVFAWCCNEMAPSIKKSFH
eukprot:gene167-222_t